MLKVKDAVVGGGGEGRGSPRNMAEGLISNSTPTETLFLSPPDMPLKKPASSPPPVMVC